ncbi:MAG: hypothetical protein ABJB05_14765 [Parafilimonas sp.]
MLRYNISGWLAIVMYYAPIIAVPILAYKLDNWWLLFCILISLIATVIASRKYKFIVLAIISILCLIFYQRNQTISFYFLSFAFGFFCMILYRIIGLGDKTSRALISIQNPDVRKELENEIGEEYQKIRSKNSQKKI